MADNKHQNRGLGYSLARERAEHMDEQTLESEANNANLSWTQREAAKHELTDRHDG